MTQEDIETALFFVRSCFGPRVTDEECWRIVRDSADAAGKTWPI